jgi:hypothetical protein
MEYRVLPHNVNELVNFVQGSLEPTPQFVMIYRLYSKFATIEGFWVLTSIPPKVEISRRITYDTKLN